MRQSRLAWLLLACLTLPLITLIAAGSGSVEVPKYCIDDSVMGLFTSRLERCGITSPLEAIEELQRTTAVEYQRGSHELHAYQWFVQQFNPYRVADCKDAELEFVPLTPLHWKVQKSAGPACTYRDLIDSITALVQQRPSSGRYMFAVASTFNMRTEMGTGMRTQVRRGEQYDKVTQFVTSTFLGHYERWPQCPDLLRKGWLGVVELPYVALGEPAPKHPGSRDAHELGDAVHLIESEVENPQFADFVAGKQRVNEVLFMGRLHQLYGPELVCSVRWSLFALAKTHPQHLRLVNITQSDLDQGVQQRLVNEFVNAKFCIIAKGDSYSSSSLYSAIYAGCVPVVVSDWYVFAFPWAIPYSQFVVRFSEENWLMDPIGCLRVLREMSASELRQRRAAMFKYRRLLHFQPLPTQSTAAVALRGLWMREQKLRLPSHVAPHSTSPLDWKHNTVFPLELLLFEITALVGNLRLELGVAKSGASGAAVIKQKQFGLVLTHDQNKIFSCETPFHCASNATDYTGTVAAPFKFSPSLQNKRSHLCTNAHRLIGMYKMVYWQRCVRVLWPLQPGKLKPIDVNLLTTRDREFIEHFHNVSHNPRPPGWTLSVYPPY